MAFIESLKYLFAAVSGSAATYMVSKSVKQEKNKQTLQIKDSEYWPKWDYNWDKRDVSSLVEPDESKSKEYNLKKIEQEREKFTPTANRHILMIRHGQYDTTLEDDRSTGLTKLGKEQAIMVGKRLKDLNLGYSKIISSTLTRALETTDFIRKHVTDLPLETTELLEEGRPIPIEPPGGGFMPEHIYFRQSSRIEAAFRRYFHRAKPSQKADSFEIMVCHANVIRYFVCRLLQFPPEAWLRFELFHCSITWVTICPDGHTHLRSYGDSGFFAKKFLTTRYNPPPPVQAA